MPYSDRLKRLDLDLESLQLRRLLHADLIMCYKIVFGLVDLHNMISLHLVLSHTHIQEAQLQALQEASLSHSVHHFFVSVS